METQPSLDGATFRCGRTRIARTALWITLLGTSVSSLAACSGGGGSSSSPVVVPIAVPSLLQQSTAVGQVDIEVTIPKSSSSSASYSTNYKSAGTKSLLIDIASSSSTNAKSTVVNCTSVCSASLTAPVGSDTFTITLYDASNATGNKLSLGQTTQSIMSNQINTVKLALGGVIASVAIATIPSFSVGTSATANLKVTAKDATGNTIIGADPFATPIQISTNDSTGAFSLSARQLADPSSTVALAYNGAKSPNASVTATVPGTVASVTVPLSLTQPAPVASPSSNPDVKFGVFARAYGAPPFGMFAGDGSLDARKLQNVLDIGARWTRFVTSPLFVDQTIFGTGHYDFGQIDKLATWQKSHNIEIVTGIEPGPVQVMSPATNSPQQVDRYPTPAAFATYCTAMAVHMSSRGAHTYSEPGNEVNSDVQRFPNGASDVAQFAGACYKAIKAADPAAIVYGLELNMDGQAGPTAFVKSLRALGCGPGTCYDGLSAHLSLRWPIPAAGTPCYPNSGGDYSVTCLSDLRTASGAPIPIMIGETVVTVPGMVPDASTQAVAAPAILRALAAAPGVKYVNYANLDECALYPTGYFSNGCLVDVNNTHVPAWEGVHSVFLGK